MSGSIRKALAIARSRLTRLLEKIANAPQIEVKPDENETDEALTKAIKYQEKAIREVRAAQRNVFALLSQWDDLLAASDVDEYLTDTDEERELKATWDQQTEVVLDRAFAIMERLNENLDQLRTQRHRSQRGRETVADEDSRMERRRSANSITTDEPPRQERVSSRPQAVPDTIPRPLQRTLPYFDGSSEKWPDFYAVFQSLVGTAPHLTDLDKLNYLRPLLRGDAEHLVAGYPNLPETYEKIMDVLRKEYGDESRLKRRLHTDLRNLSVGDESTEASWKMLRKVERITYQLKRMGDDIEHPQVQLAIVEKLPNWLMVKVLKKMRKEPTWTTTPLLLYLDKEILVRRAVEQVMASRKKPKPTTATVTDALGHGQCLERHNQGARNYPLQREERKPHCLFCDVEHFSLQCIKFPTPETRSKKLEEMGRCRTCTRVAHPGRDCGRRLACHFCKSYEHPTVTCYRGPGGNGRKLQRRQGDPQYK